MRNNELRGQAAIELDIIPSDTEHLFEKEAHYQETMVRYHCAILEMRTKLEVLSKDLAVRYRRNPIEFIESRLKKPSSIARKLRKAGHDVTVENMMEYVSDIAGIRVLCAYIDDIYEIARPGVSAAVSSRAVAASTSVGSVTVVSKYAIGTRSGISSSLAATYSCMRW